jgi:hypothetical protein
VRARLLQELQGLAGLQQVQVQSGGVDYVVASFDVGVEGAGRARCTVPLVEDD